MGTGHPKTPKKGQRRKSSLAHILESGSVEELISTKKRTRDNLQHAWTYYSELAYQRNQIDDKLKQSSREASISGFEFKKWQRLVTCKYSLHPLSTEGSIRDIGGRFNMGMEVNPNLPHFPALYLASNRKVAFLETFGQDETPGTALTPLDAALTKERSVAVISTIGKLDHVLDIRDENSLKSFVNLIKGFRLTSKILRQARLLGQASPEVVTTPRKLIESLLASNWRALPRLFDVPANSQIFGHIANRAGIDAILYPSVRGDGDCLAVFPSNFKHTSSFVTLDDPAPSEDVPSRIDKNTYLRF